MARFVAGAVFGLVVGVVGAAAMGLHAQDPANDVAEAAAQAHVDPQDLAGAVATTGVDAYTYLRGVGELPPLERESPLNSRVECIIAKETGGANVANRRGSGAVGVAQYMPSTFFAHAAEMGHVDWSPWNPAQARAVAAHDLALGRRAQWTVGGCP